jgi:hypothetical protein
MGLLQFVSQLMNFPSLSSFLGRLRASHQCTLLLGVARLDALRSRYLIAVRAVGPRFSRAERGSERPMSVDKGNFRTSYTQLTSGNQSRIVV